MSARILVVDDIPAIRRSMRLYLEQEADWVICGEAENGKVAVDRVQELPRRGYSGSLDAGHVWARPCSCNQGNCALNSHPYVHPAHLSISIGRGP
jgi:CheY-like chemotaxis protein